MIFTTFSLALACSGDPQICDVLGPIGLTPIKEAAAYDALVAQRDAAPCAPSVLLSGTYQGADWVLPGGSGTMVPTITGTLDGLDITNGVRDGWLFTADLGTSEWLTGTAVQVSGAQGVVLSWRGECAAEPLLVVMGGQSLCVGPELEEPVFVDNYYVDGVLKPRVTRGALELPWLEMGATVYKRCKGATSLEVWTSDYYPGLLEDIDGRTPDVLIWSHGQKDARDETDANTYGTRVQPVFEGIGATKIAFPLLSAPALSPTNQATINASVVALPTVSGVQTDDLPRDPDGVHLPESSARILADRIVEAMGY